MDQPIFWSALLAVALLAGVVRLYVGHPFHTRRATAIGGSGLVVTGVSVVLLVFHCAAMFFGPWVDAIPGAQDPADAVRAMGAASRWAYWVPAALLVLGWRRVWWPGLLLLVVTLVGVGATMFWPYPLSTHLAWLAAVILVGVVISTALIRSQPPADTRPAHLHPAAPLTR